MITLHKNGGTKVLDSASSLIDALKKEGWIVEEVFSSVDTTPRRGRPKKDVFDVVSEVEE